MLLSQQEIHQMGMNLVGKHLVENGFEFLAVKSELGHSPQFVCLKMKRNFFCSSSYSYFPDNPDNYDETWMLK